MKIVSKELINLEMQNNHLRAENEQLKADLAYVMMMTGVEIPEEEDNEVER